VKGEGRTKKLCRTHEFWTEIATILGAKAAMGNAQSPSNNDPRYVSAARFLFFFHHT